MADCPHWWRRPRRVSVVVDNPSWVLPYAARLVEDLGRSGDHASLCRRHEEIEDGAVAFYLGCTRITPPDVLARNRRNLVVHASDLPKGRGFSPLTWLTLAGERRIPVCLFEAEVELDDGAVIYREALEFEGHELIDEMRRALGDIQVMLCRHFLAEEAPPIGTPQVGEPTVYGRRRPSDSRIDPHKPIDAQFDLLRTVDNDSYPAFFELRGHRYKIAIEKLPEPESDDA